MANENENEVTTVAAKKPVAPKKHVKETIKENGEQDLKEIAGIALKALESMVRPAAEHAANCLRLKELMIEKLNKGEVTTDMADKEVEPYLNKLLHIKPKI